RGSSGPRSTGVRSKPPCSSSRFSKALNPMRAPLPNSRVLRRDLTGTEHISLLNLPRHRLHHLIDRHLGGVDEDVTGEPGQGGVGAGAVAEVAAGDFFDDVVVGDGAAGGDQLVEAAADADLGTGVEVELEGG